MRRTAAALFALAAALAAATPSSATAGGDLVLLDGLVKFPRKARSDGALRGRVQFSADFLGGVDEFRPAEGLCVMLGPCGILRRGQVDGEVLGRVSDWGEWTVKAKRPWGRGTSVKLKFNPDSGSLEVKARGVDLAPIARASGGAFEVQFLAGRVLHYGDADLAVYGGGAKWVVIPPPVAYTPPGQPDILPPPPITGGVDGWGTGAGGDDVTSGGGSGDWMDIPIGDPGPWQ